MGSLAPPLPHVAVFPFMARGHTIPLLHLARLLHRRRLATLTFFTTPLNAPFLRGSLAGTDAAVVELPFPHDSPGLPSGVESLTSMPLLLPFVRAAEQLRPHFEAALERLPPVSFLISDGFLGWTKDSAAKLGIPRIAFYPMGASAMAISSAMLLGERPHGGLAAAADQAFEVVGQQRNVCLTDSGLCPTAGDQNPHVLLSIEFFREAMRVTRASHGVIINSFRELEPASFDHWGKNIGQRAWCVGPVCMAEKAAPPGERPEVMEWLDSRWAVGRPVLYVAFGTQAELPEPQMREIAAGLERSGLDFLWVVGAREVDLGEGFEGRVAERGRVVRGWAEQVDILRHGSVGGFVSHCGWNSVVEAVSAGVPILAWPTTEEQALNAGLAVEELRVGMRVPASEGMVGREEVERMVRELLFGGKGKEAAERAKELADAAAKAVAPGGSSWCALEQLIDEMNGGDREGTKLEN